MAVTPLLGIAWRVWKMATKRVGPVGGLVVTAVVIGGLVYLGPWLVENVPAVGRIVGDRGRVVESARPVEGRTESGSR